MTSEESEQLLELIHACHSALIGCEKANEDKKEIITVQEKEIDVQAKRIAELEASQGADFMTIALWFMAGAATGILVHSVVSR